MTATSLNLIPGSGKEFRDKEYWDKFFKQRGTKAFEWYGEYENLCDVLHKYVKLTDQVLMIGCGNSKLSENMFDVGIKHIMNIDLSNVVIQQMSAKNKHRKEMQFVKMDMLNMDFEDSKFDVVIDKGTLDALMSDMNEKVNEDCDKLFTELDRVLKVGGRYMCISLAQDHILEKLLNSFKERGWIIRIHRIDEQDLDFYLPVFVFVFTKMKMKMPNPFFELKLDISAEKFIRYESVDETKTRIKEYQNYGLTKFYISNKTVDINDDVFVHLYDVTNDKFPKYTIFIIDSPAKFNKSKMNGLFAVFVVPIGKETEWLFSSKQGREELTSQAKYQRLAVVHLNRAHTYGTLDSIISELSPKVRDLAPKGIPSSYKIPLLSMGPDVDVRDLKFRGSSDVSGEFFIEDVTPSNSSEPTRRLVFQSISPLIQTEAILKKPNKKSTEKSISLDYNSFLEDYISVIIGQLYSIKIKPDEHLKILIIGLGGGVLANYCKNWLKNCHIDAVEIDEKIANVAKEWFGLKEDDKTCIFIDDGIKFIKEAKEQKNKKWNVVVVDINSNNPNNDLWGPTKEFLDKDVLDNYKSTLTDNGVLVINLICLNESLKKDILNSLKTNWKNVYLNKLPKNRNEIVFCFNQDYDELFLKNAFTEKNQNLNNKNGNSLALLNDIVKNFKKVDISA